MVDLEPITDEDLALERTEYLSGTLESHGWVDVRRDKMQVWPSSRVTASGNGGSALEKINRCLD